MTNENKHMCKCGRPATLVYVKSGKVSCDTCTIELGESIAPLGAGWDPPIADELRRSRTIDPLQFIQDLFKKKAGGR